MKKVLLLIACISMFSFLNAQTVNLGNPIGWNGKLESKDVPVLVMPGYNQTAIDAQDIIDDQAKNKPWRFGYKYAVNFNFNNSGVWSTLPNGDKIWQLAIECKNALTVNLLFKNLPSSVFIIKFLISNFLIKFLIILVLVSLEKKLSID